MFLLLLLSCVSGCKSAPAQCRQADVNHTCTIQTHPYYLVPPQSLSRQQIKTKLMLHKPLFIVHGRVKGFLEVIL